MNLRKLLGWAIPLSLLLAAPALAEGPAATGALTSSNQVGAVIMFWLLALGAVGGSLFVVTRPNMISAVMGMVGTFFAIAGLYAMLYAHFLAVIQVLVYAGAIMVLFVFVIMILNRAEDDVSWAGGGPLAMAKAFLGWASKPVHALSLIGLGYLVSRLCVVLWQVKDQAVQSIPVDLGPTSDAFGTTKAMGKVLFTKYLFPFEAVSIVLLVAVVGAITIARPSADDAAKEAK